jgi:ABC-type cobalamin/Fe3+-siderophores transport system ATPase subunit
LAVITCSKIALGYGDRAVLTDFSAEFKAGTISSILGTNGCGKSTLLSALSGDLQPQFGEIVLQGRSLSRYSAKELSSLRSVAVQSHHYWMSYTTSEILHLGHESVSQERFDYLIKALALESFLHQSVTTVSGGQLQRIEIARALLKESPIVLLDEPFASQDLSSIAAITKLLMAEREAGRTIILVAHARREDLSWCDQVIELETR